jgi:hypothetical protein
MKISYESPKASRFPREPEEERIYKAWVDLCEEGEGTFLQNMLDPGSPIPPQINQRDAEVATLTIQWLGSPVGQAFLRDLGYTKR